MSDEQSIHELVKAAQAGERAAFEQLLATYYEMIFRTAYKWCGVRSDAEDITQNVCMKLAEVIGQYRGDSSFSTWLYRITLNTAKDYQKSRMRKAAREQGDEDLERFACTKPDQEQSLIAAQLYKCISALPEKLRMAVMLVAAEGLSHAEAAAALLCKEGTISWRMSEAKKKLALCLEKGVH